ncbi:hypothetical protein BN946_scf185002.g46 [Trametes cinnabarina]|uniref:Uncharacterized protein n=1 Tax=Pycnoporus cinnabarinus TaxID=5643 RepID=A0A060SF97_PYCCI|nr:hypothetical protein BN946_scf185002.g46 [Trametes cinnabarina]
MSVSSSGWHSDSILQDDEIPGDEGNSSWPSPPGLGTQLAAQALLTLGDPDTYEEGEEMDVAEETEDGRWSPFSGIHSYVPDANDGASEGAIAGSSTCTVHMNVGPDSFDRDALPLHPKKPLTWPDIVGESDSDDSSVELILPGSPGPSSPELPLSSLLEAKPDAKTGLKITLPPLSRLKGKASDTASQSRTPNLAGRIHQRTPGRSHSGDVSKLALKSSLKSQYKKARLANAMTKVSEAVKHPRRAPRGSRKASPSKGPSWQLPGPPTSRPKSRAGRPDFEAVIDHLSKPGWPVAASLLRKGQDTNVKPISKKTAAAGQRGALPKISEELERWSVAAYIEVEHFQEVQKSARSKKKLEPQIWRGGPVTVTHATTWPSLLQAIAEAASVEKENLVVASLCWRFAPGLGGKAGSVASNTLLPMTNNIGFDAFVKDGILACRATRNIIIRMAPPMRSVITVDMNADNVNPIQPWGSMTNQRIKAGQQPGPLEAFASSVRTRNNPDSDSSDNEVVSEKRNVRAKKSKGKPSIDALLAPIVEKLKTTNVVGQCPHHPGIRCFYQRESDLHFELDSNRLLVWASSIDKGDEGVDLNHVPVHSHFFQASQALKVAPANAHMQQQGHHILEGPGFASHQPQVQPVGPPVSLPGPMPMYSPMPYFMQGPGVFPAASPYGMMPYYPPVMPGMPPAPYYPVGPPGTMPAASGHQSYLPNSPAAGPSGSAYR